MSSNPASPPNGVSRRGFLSGSATLAVATPFVAHAAEQAAPGAAAKDPHAKVAVSFNINGKPYQLGLDARTSLLDALRDHAGLTGTKKGCDHGQCGACSVLVDGRRVLSCMSFAVMQEGAEITTIEGLASTDGALHPMQQAFVDHDAFQCGYCTPGQIMSAVGCVQEGHAENDDDIREYMSGNLCRCAAYPNIVAAIRQARDDMKEG
ncbi:oxidoreductase [Tianweitania populi]|uniref:Oxidoreductase n=1 Tax=Tianweitania populi TaxID=1607949 RepID=A0A8J3DLX1_9HYPH|nr:(2Fe-2S)-binding protein [Tianweitania populi]GHD05039.1 oxidoreductase [Tianweitania populi]